MNEHFIFDGDFHLCYYAYLQKLPFLHSRKLFVCLIAFGNRLDFLILVYTEVSNDKHSMSLEGSPLYGNLL